MAFVTARRAGQCTPRTASSSAPYAGAVISDVNVASRRIDPSQQVADDPFDADTLGFRGEVRQNAVAQHWEHDALDVVRRHDEATGERRVCFRAEYERLSRSRAGAPPYVMLHQIGRASVVRPRGAHECSRVPENGIGSAYVAHQRLQCDQLIGAEDGGEARRGGAGRTAQDRNLVVLLRIADANVEQKAIELCL